MNAKTAKLIRKFGVASNRNPEILKKLWTSTPRRFRRDFRKAMQDVLAAL